MAYEWGIASWQGARDYQEDSAAMLFHDACAIGAVVADGMGGCGSGDLASHLVVQAFQSVAEQYDPMLPEHLQMALHRTTESIASAAKSAEGNARMGSTVVCGLIEGVDLHWVSVGDSLLFHWRAGALIRLNADHSYAPLLQEYVRRGQMSEEEMQADKRMHALRSVMNARPPALIDQPQRPYSLQGGDIVLFASDGLLTLDESTIAALCKRARKQPPQQLADRLIQEVQQAAHPAQDNVTVIVVKLLG